MKEEKKSTIGVVGICLGFFIPLVGIILGIISLAKKEKSVAVGVISIVIGTVGWIFAWFFIMAMIGFSYGMLS